MKLNNDARGSTSKEESRRRSNKRKKFGNQNIFPGASTFALISFQLLLYFEFESVKVSPGLSCVRIYELKMWETKLLRVYKQINMVFDGKND